MIDPSYQGRSEMRWDRKSFPGASALAVTHLAMDKHGTQGLQASPPTGASLSRRKQYKFIVIKDPCEHQTQFGKCHGYQFLWVEGSIGAATFIANTEERVHLRKNSRFGRKRVKCRS